VCGAARDFEAQLMPQMLNALQVLSPDAGVGVHDELDFGTVAVYTCTKSCMGDKGTQQEWVHVQGAEAHVSEAAEVVSEQE
jgi:hypothetical protein